MDDALSIRPATAADVSLVLEFIRELARYERLARTALERGCARLEWWVLDWNEPSIGFHRSLGAVPQDEWTTMRVSGAALERLASG